MKHYKLPEPPSGMMLNTNMVIVDSIYESLATKTNGFCPCVPKYLHSNEDYRCPCKDARESKKCKCQIFIEVT